MFKRITTTAALLGTLTLSAGCVDEIMSPASGPAKAAPTSSDPLPICSLSGDLSGDGIVDATDVALFAHLMRADLNRDGAVDAADLDLLAAVLQGTPIDVDGNGTVDASDYAAFGFAKRNADLNGDGAVDATDVAIFSTTKSRLDVNVDGQADSQDREEIVKHLGESCP